MMIDFGFMAGIGTMFAISAPVGGDGSAWAEWGLAGMVVAYVLWRDWMREKRMSEAIERDHKWVRETLLAALERNTAALQKMARNSREDANAGGSDSGR